MRRFFVDDRSAYSDLERRARRACVMFADCELPPGCTPGRGRVGFEVLPSGEVCLYVDHGVVYGGGNEAVRTWLRDGAAHFGSFGELRTWILGELAPAYRAGRGSPAQRAAPESPPAHQPVPEALTDLDEVTVAATPRPGALLDDADLVTELRKRVYGQDDVLAVVARRVSRHVGRSQPRRPTTLFALGDTGIGKTRTAAALAESLGELLAGRWSKLVRLNMNEYQERHRVSQLLGAPPSYVGYADGTQLIDALVAEPECVVLFDEIEKAHADVLQALLSAMDSGELSAAAPRARGRVIDCRRAIFFFTSNVDAKDILAELDASAGRGGSVDEICRRHVASSGIRPELVGRVGAFLPFRPLSPRARAEIATAAVARVAAEYGLTVTRVDPEIVSEVVSRPDGGLGARPDEYFVDDLLGSSFARAASQGIHGAVAVRADPTAGGTRIEAV